jgi:hypothetical protein
MPAGKARQRRAERRGRRGPERGGHDQEAQGVAARRRKAKASAGVIEVARQANLGEIPPGGGETWRRLARLLNKAAYSFLSSG